MSDPLTQAISLLKPRAVFSRPITAAGAWSVRYTEFGQPSFCTVLEGSCLLVLQGEEPLTLQAGDFVLLPATPGFVLSGFEPAEPQWLDPDEVAAGRGELRYGRRDGPPELRILGGHFDFDSLDAELLVSLLPAVVHVRGDKRLALLVELVGGESDSQRPGRDMVLARLVEVMLIEALRSAPDKNAPRGMLRGLADARLAQAIRQMHAEPARAWTVAQLAREAALSRSAFFERFTQIVGLPPMEYLLTWRMALAKELLRRRQLHLVEVAEQVGYSSASAFSTAFRRLVGQSPGRYARQLARVAKASQN